MSSGLVRVEAATPDVLELASAHHTWAATDSPAQDVHALPADELTGEGITLLAARSAEGELLGMCALRRLNGEHAELKAMQVRAEARSSGVGRGLVNALLDLARRHGYRRVSLETGARESFAAARALYESVGFAPCPPFGGYPVSPNSICMTLSLAIPGAEPPGPSRDAG